MSRLYGRLSPYIAHKPGSAAPAKAHAWLIRRTGGRIGGRFLGGAPLLVLRTVGRKSGATRESPMIYIRDEDRFVVCASNAASRRPPAWWLNLQAQPAAEAFVKGRWHRVRAREASPEEAERLWPRMRAAYDGFDLYEQRTSRELPLVVLDPL